MICLKKTLTFLCVFIIPLVLSVPYKDESSEEVQLQTTSGLTWLDSGRDDPDNIRFYLFPNPSKPEEMEEIIFGNASSLKSSQFKKNTQTKFLVHGFIQNVNADFPQNVKNAYLKRMRRTGESWNIVVVDWGKLAYDIQDGFPFYDRAVKNVEPTGVRVAEFITFLLDNGMITGMDQIHLIGQSLGAHVVGKCGDTIHKKYVDRVQRVTGLDPAGPFFYSKIVSRRLETWDGEFVDVYHCDEGGYGIQESVGDIEFFPNPKLFGRLQPQCLKIRQILESPDMCSHNYCPKFFAFAINNPIVAQKCVSKDFFLMGFKTIGCSGKTALYGEDVSKTNERGKYFVKIPNNLDDPNIFL